MLLPDDHVVLMHISVENQLLRLVLLALLVRDTERVFFLCLSHIAPFNFCQLGELYLCVGTFLGVQHVSVSIVNLKVTTLS